MVIINGCGALTHIVLENQLASSKRAALAPDWEK
jgi:hypothetical protein